MGDYCRRRDGGCEGFADRQLAWTGHVVGFATEVQGYKGDRLPLTWTVYDVAVGRRVPASAFGEWDRWPDGVYGPKDQTIRESGEIWVPLPEQMTGKLARGVLGR